MHVLITGGTGLIGKHLTKKLIAKDYDVSVLGRNKRKTIDLFGSKVNPIIWSELDEIQSEPDVIIHLAGHNIGNNFWTQSNMQMAFDSRIKTAKSISDWCNRKQINPKIIAASGVTYYGFYDNCEHICSEDSPAKISHKQFTQELAFACEESFSDFNTIKLRLGAVLDKHAGIMPKILLPAKFGASAVIGTGMQPMAWIALEDAVDSIIFLITQKFHGPINITAPEILNQKKFMQELARSINRPLLLKMPEKILQIFAGEFAEQFLLRGQAVSCDRLINLGFKHKYNNAQDWFLEHCK